MKHASLMHRLAALEDRKLALEEERERERDEYWDRAIRALATADSPEDDAWHQELMGHIGNEFDFLTETGEAILFDLNPVSDRKDFPTDERRWTYLRAASQT